MTNLALGHALSCRDLFVNFKSDKVDLKDKTCYDWHTKRAAANIFSKSAIAEYCDLGNE